MDQFEARMEVELDLRPPTLGENREVVLRRCLEGADDIILLVRALGEKLRKYPDLQNEFAVFLRQMRIFFEPEVPGRLDQAVNEWQEWQGEFGDPAA